LYAAGRGEDTSKGFPRILFGASAERHNCTGGAITDCAALEGRSSAAVTIGLARGTGRHLLKLYDSDRDLVAELRRFVLGGLEDGVVVVIATAEHRALLESDLHFSGVDVSVIQASGQYIYLDAREALRRLLVEPGIDHRGIDHKEFSELTSVIKKAVSRSPHGVRVFGEVVSLLWDSGDVLRAIELESLWNAFGREVDFSLLCAYANEAVSSDPDGLARICDLHSDVINATPADDKTEPSREFVAEFDPTVDSPGLARHMVMEVLRSWGSDEDLVDDASIVVTELASNAVLHVGKPYSVELSAETSGFRISVKDSSQAVPNAYGRTSKKSGRGMTIVAALSTCWGVNVSADSKTIWAEFS
jgi:hypothetical protein